MKLNSKIGRNKRGASVDNFWAMAQYFAIGIFFVIMIMVWNVFSGTSIWDESSIGNNIKDNAQDAVDMFDWMLLMGWLGLHLGILVMAYLLRSYPIMYVGGILLCAVLIVVAMPLSNAYEEFVEDAEFSAAASNMPKNNVILTHLPFFEGIFALFTLIVMFGLARGEGFI